MDEPSDFDLVAQWQAGDATAGETLTRRHYESVVRFFELKAPRVAEDLTQRTFLAVVEGQLAFRGHGSFRAYLFGIARRKLLRHLRDGYRLERVVVFAEHDRHDSAPTPSRVVASREEQRVLLRALDDLDPDSQIALQLFYWEGLRNREIAEALDIPLSTVTSRLHRARTALRASVETLPAKASARASLIGDLEGWTRSLAGAHEGAPGPSGDAG